MADLRRRLEALPVTHPSAGAAADASARLGGTGRAGDADLAVEADRADSAGDLAADDRDQPRPDDRPAGEPVAADRRPGPGGGLDESSRLPAGAPRGGGHDPLLPYGPLAAGRGGYRPWFADSGMAAPWFTAEVTEDQDG